MPEATPTTNHDEIRRWAEERGARPAIIRTGQGPDGILRFDFGDDDARLEEVSWDEFFRVFDDNRLALPCQEQIVSGQQSRFFRFVERHTSSGVTHEPAMQGETESNRNMNETAEPPMSEGQSDKAVGRRQASTRASMNDMDEDMSVDRTDDQMREGPSRRSTARRQAELIRAKRQPFFEPRHEARFGGAEIGRPEGQQEYCAIKRPENRKP
jgi:hypothetical protein